MIHRSDCGCAWCQLWGKSWMTGWWMRMSMKGSHDWLMGGYMVFYWLERTKINLIVPTACYRVLLLLQAAVSGWVLPVSISHILTGAVFQFNFFWSGRLSVRPWQISTHLFSATPPWFRSMILRGRVSHSYSYGIQPSLTLQCVHRAGRRPTRLFTVEGGKTFSAHAAGASCCGQGRQHNCSSIQFNWQGCVCSDCLLRITRCLLHRAHTHLYSITHWQHHLQHQPWTCVC